MSTNIAKLMIENVNGSTFIALTTETVPQMRKTVSRGNANPHYGRVTKITSGANVMVFQNKNTNGYNNMVQSRLKKEGIDPSTFELQPRKWGTRIPNTPFIEHNGKYYLEVIFLNPGVTEYQLDGQKVNKEDIQGLPEKREAHQGGLENKVIIRTYSVDSIKSVVINGEKYDDLYFNLAEV